MALLIPSHIQLENLQGPIAYEWSDKNPYPILGSVNPHTEEQLKKLSDRAILSFSISCAEWVVYRLLSLCDDDRPMKFLEACWVCEMSLDYATPPESNEEDWKGPIRGAIDLSLMTILNTIISIEGGEAHVDAAFAELIPLHVLLDPTPFIKWRKIVYDRLTLLSLRTENDTLGNPVPREALDPGVEVSISSSPYFVSQFLEKIDPETNPFIRK